MKKTLFATLIMLLALAASALAAYDLQFVVVRNDMANNGYLDVKVQIASTGSTFNMGTSSLVFTYNTSAVNPQPLTITPHSFSGTMYQTMTLTEPFVGRLSLNIDLFVPNMGTLVPMSWTDVATVRFTIINKELKSNLVWRTEAPNYCVVYAHDQATVIGSGTLTPLDATLPVQLSAFTAINTAGVVKLAWTTQSEVNTVGFYVYRREGDTGEFQRISPLIESAGTSAAPRQYGFVDDRLEKGHTYTYLLEDRDVNGLISWHGPITVMIETVQLPEIFYVEQNYPNPFNPTTTIEYGLPEAAEVRIQIFNMRGELVRTLVDGLQQPGNLTRVWDGRNDLGMVVPSGVYFCRVQSGVEHRMIKMIFAK
ncbi:MAG TPA: FlgD immunoglobulin-like domain containing protein [bacterium]|nr:FlgD immunoglobulin-like domain containing protein [bacterium]HQG46844.1 FlgD immunoglobulin-like domain containing protein [bacterium]HQI49003.1 FlgD immunoglobulin-like domain containing protein [bacterium]HQJ65086.1 FlgD immunoglobulin-like domain containing protein [bacterium]